MSKPEGIRTKFLDPKTNRIFEAKTVKLPNGDVGYLAPLWVKSSPQEWLIVEEQIN